MAFVRKTYETRQEKRRDFWIGFLGWFGANTVLTVLAWGGTYLLSSLPKALVPADETIETLLSVLVVIVQITPLFVNIGALILLAFTRKWMALGAVAAFGASLVISLLLGLLFVVACFGLVFALSAGQ